MKKPNQTECPGRCVFIFCPRFGILSFIEKPFKILCVPYFRCRIKNGW
jgi:hypothetical protein